MLMYLAGLEKKTNFLWPSLGSNQYRALRVYGLCVLIMTGALEGSMESGSREAGNQTCGPWFTRHNTYPLKPRRLRNPGADPGLLEKGLRCIKGVSIC